MKYERNYFYVEKISMRRYNLLNITWADIDKILI